MNQQVEHHHQQQQAQQQRPVFSPALTALASRLNVDEQTIQNIVVNTLVAAKGDKQPTNEEFVTFLAIANEYKLNPLTKEIYAFSNRGKVQVIVSIDGWLKIINSHPQFDGLETIENFVDGKLFSITCKIYRKDRDKPTVISELLNECAGTSEPWKKWPARMLRHKATIQAARYAFGLALLDEDEAERIQSVNEKDVTPRQSQNNTLAISQDEVSAWENALASISTVGEYEQLKAEMVSQYSGNAPAVLRGVFSSRLMELKNANSL